MAEKRGGLVATGATAVRMAAETVAAARAGARAGDGFSGGGDELSDCGGWIRW
jgi:hypothetical protein